MTRRPPRSALLPYPTLFRSIDLHRKDRLDGVIPILPQAGFDFGRPHRAAPIALQHFDVCAHRGRAVAPAAMGADRSEEHTSELQSHLNLACRLLLEKKKTVT